MFYFSSPLFWYRLIFLAELIIAEGLFTFNLKKRSKFLLRVAGAIIFSYLVVFLFPILSFEAIYVSFMFLFFFAVTVFALMFCYDEPLINVLFCAIAAYAAQHIAYELNTFILTLLNLDSSSAPYGETGKLAFSVWSFAIYLESYGAIYALLYAVFGTRIKVGADLKIGNAALLALSGFIVVVAVLLNAFLTYRKVENPDNFVMCMCHGYNLVCCGLALIVQFSMLGKKEIQSELDTLQRLHEEQRRHYALFKENVDYINVKCHDLKHQVMRLAQGMKADDSVIRDIENALMIYDSDVKTGSETLDVILTEKRLACVKNNIIFSCIADGKKLKFMSDADICSLFGNALDNAIEAVCRIEDEKKRSIGLNLKESKGFLSLSVRNGYFVAPVFKDGLPRSIKGDEINHGFGMKSLKAIAEKYGGEMSVSAADGVFTLNMLFPLENLSYVE